MAGARGHIPSFVGANQAPGRPAALPAWKAARVSKVNPGQGPVRGPGTALADGKTVYMAVLCSPPRTARDRLLVRAEGEHRVLTTSQLAALGLRSVITARHRLTVLAEIGALRRFRPHREVGSAPWHYLLGPVGAPAGTSF
jgi:Replication-relaxation